ncbi:hypothetical protein [Goodfellowiella coeruleoviolacea]|uniref:Secreted protein n=1 Tax=Goodfellowiella coeruleoviolacea TaxID=334858 RepID=A0AAE3KG41_9PSEU|nr:hypothetical protein [Goodfellowiella coeruleoviolacea]MCP2165650.1 hypothetical protein [Goodfellowiella coeruleoviolacea]
MKTVHAPTTGRTIRHRLRSVIAIAGTLVVLLLTGSAFAHAAPAETTHQASVAASHSNWDIVVGGMAAMAMLATAGAVLWAAAKGRHAEP